MHKAGGEGGSRVEQSLHKASGAVKDVCHSPDRVHSVQLQHTMQHETEVETQVQGTGGRVLRVQSTGCRVQGAEYRG